MSNATGDGWKLMGIREVEQLMKIKSYAESQYHDCRTANAQIDAQSKQSAKQKRQRLFNQGAGTAYEDIIRHIDMMTNNIYEASFERKFAVRA